MSTHAFGHVLSQLTPYQVDSWFKDLVNDDDVLQATPLHRDGNFEKIASLVWSKGTGIAAMFRGRRLQVATGVDIGVLRYPDYGNPYFKVLSYHHLCK